MSLHAWELLSPRLLRRSKSDAWAASSNGDKNHLDFARKRNERGEVTIPMGMYRYHQQIDNPDCGLSVYTSPLRELTECLVCLTIDNIEFDTHELLSLARLNTLAVLELVERDRPYRQPYHPISDSLIRGWSEVAAEQGPFPELRILRIASWHEVTEASLHHVLKFPKLEIFEVTHAYRNTFDNATHIAEEYGWKTTDCTGQFQPKSVFVEWAKAYLDQEFEWWERKLDRPFLWWEGHIGYLNRYFQDDAQEVALTADPRTPICEGCKAALEGNPEGKPEKHSPPASSGTAQKDKVTYLDDGWKLTLQRNHRFTGDWGWDESKSEKVRLWLSHLRRREMTDDQIFWLLGLFAQREFATHHVGIQARVEGIPLPGKRFASIRLRRPSSRPGYWRDQLIFTRTSKSHCKVAEKAKDTNIGKDAERKQTDLNPRKRRYVGDVFASLGL
jgi:hypothetical protein